MRFDNISRLLDNIAADLEKQGYFFSKPDGTVVSQQTSVVRSNCMDCLDRTNVAQAALARRSLLIQLVGLGIMDSKSTLEDYKEFDRMLKNSELLSGCFFFLFLIYFFQHLSRFTAWADNADAVSLVYSGTGALKTDFTRTGKRTLAGSVQDGINSVLRYVKNNYMDGFRQDSMDLFLGNYAVRSGQPSPFSDLENNDDALRRKLVLTFFLSFFLSSFSFSSSTSIRIGFRFPRSCCLPCLC